MVYIKNLNEYAQAVVHQEGLKESISIAQVKELLKIVFTDLAAMDIFELVDVLRRYRK